MGIDPKEILLFMDRQEREELGQDKGPGMAKSLSAKYREAVSQFENLAEQRRMGKTPGRGERMRRFDTDKWLQEHNITPTWDYDYDRALRSGDRPVDGKWPSKHKHDLSPERYQSTSEGWLDTKATDATGENVYADWTEVLTQEMRRGEYLDRKAMWDNMGSDEREAFRSESWRALAKKTGEMLRKSFDKNK